MRNTSDYIQYRKEQLELKKQQLEILKLREEITTARLKRKMLIFTVGISGLSLLLSVFRGR
ncbi:hypothetical protein KAM448_35180 [Aeromonas caviae]|uniref:Uncharacterized protein n=1 Tax=Aeromonas caviae TaxID=648 RepID=A0ABD0B862_AERCA|nr:MULTISPECIES: hypothetical protein [Aeromonas]BCK65799.1 hypothetical protein KAM330_47880 [Aeromonas hydrophila]BCR31391.1 hypothetical protein KAM376_43970 [Aeromonas caviae]GJA71840.1 hypothetical protein KAM353_14870 [Aeromonas caviae]GJA81687.1 hypothetical protein KAM355_22470 [Aeromonas caviae]GJB00714.1 hypothetical protein KAM359_41210 [Aeromonas caviae]